MKEMNVFFDKNFKFFNHGGHLLKSAFEWSGGEGHEL